ncbi:MAG: cysteine desulfurase [candidate division Zixibacteria bacterium]|nr:cysteine desulfurase [candidate division Zixibacteria bacterium]
MDPNIIRRDFPILNRQINGHRLVYLDNAATTQKPSSVINAMDEYYRFHNANVHRGLHTLAEEATTAYESTRAKIAEFIGGVKPSEIIYTRGTTESINLVAQSWGRANVGPHDRIVITQMEHHANLVPWLMLAKRAHAELEYIPINAEGYLNLDNIDTIINGNTKIVAVTQMSNVLGTINPVDRIIDRAHKVGAVVLVDGAQAVPHLPVNVKSLDADFYVFSAHKMLGPTGLGVLYGKERLLEEMEPIEFGGEMISRVQFDSAEWNILPYKFEAGTPHIAGAYGFGPALDYLTKLGMEAIRNHEIELTSYALEKLHELKYVKIFGPLDENQRGGVISFKVKDIHPHDLATVLDSYGIAVRAGHHCAQPLTNLLGEISTTRASLYIYNNKDDVDELVKGLIEARRYFGRV